MGQTTREFKGNSIRVLKEANKYLVLQCIMTLSPLATEDIVKNTGLSRPTVLNILRELEEDEVVIKDGFSESNGGRSAALLTLNGSKHLALGIDFEFPAVRMVIANLKGEIHSSRKSSTTRRSRRTSCCGISTGSCTTSLPSPAWTRPCWTAWASAFRA